MDKREILLNLKIAHEQLLKKNYKNGRMQTGIMIKCIEDDFKLDVLREGKESPDENSNCIKPDVIKSVCDSCGCEHDLKVMKLCPDCLNSYFEQHCL